MTKDIVIVSALRTAIGNFSGSLSTFSAAQLGEIVIRETITRTGVSGDDVSEVILGQVLQAACGQNAARQASVNAGVGKSVPA